MEKMTGERPRPPRHLIEPSQDAVHFGAIAQEGAAFDRGEHIALEHDGGLPASGEGIRGHRGCGSGDDAPSEVGTRGAGWAASIPPPVQKSRSRRARVVNARRFAIAFAAPRSRSPAARRGGDFSSGGNRPKLTFMGWNERGPASIVSLWPPGMCATSAPRAVYGARPSRASPPRPPPPHPTASAP